ncbi:MAG TPA: hypothetical protein VHI71_03585 [Actinomycetota bacterium]|nr:hypothetical protein [Actinomycetota bacterium]
MRRLSFAMLTSFLILTACSDDAGSDRAEETPLQCQTSPTDGCLTLRNPLSNGPRRSYVHLATIDRDPVRQYGITPTLPFGRGHWFTRPLKAGEYIISFFEGRPKDMLETSWIAQRACGREFRIRPLRTFGFKVRWPRGTIRCTIERQ